MNRFERFIFKPPALPVVYNLTLSYYLEPDQRFGKAYLEVIKGEVFCDSIGTANTP